MDDCQVSCWDVWARAKRHNSGNWPFIFPKSFYIISAAYRQEKKFDQANECMKKSAKILAF